MGEVTDTEVLNFVDKAGQEAVADAFACVEMAADRTAKQACKQSEAKTALADSLGEDAADVTESEVEQYVRKAAKNKVGDEMETCMTLAGNVDNEIKACKNTKAKAALAKS